MTEPREPRRPGRWLPALVAALLVLVVPTVLGNRGLLDALGATGDTTEFVELAVAQPQQLSGQVSPQGAVALKLRITNRTHAARRITWRADTLGNGDVPIATGVATGGGQVGVDESLDQTASFTIACDRRTQIRVSIIDPASSGATIHVWVDSSADSGASPTTKGGSGRAAPTCSV